MAGMLAARALANVFENVVVLERDALPEGPEPRPGVPQAKHLHALLPRGRRILESYFPGITAQLKGSGAEMLDIAKDIAWLTPQGWGVRFASEFEGLSSTRMLLETAVRIRLKKLLNIKLLPNCEVTGLVGDARRIDGVRFHLRGEEAGGAELKADLVVAATGRHSVVSKWLRELEMPEAETTCINAHVGYASRMYRRPERSTSDWRAIFLQAAPPDYKRAGILFPVEGNRWLVTLQGGDRDYPPTDEAGFLEFVRGLRSPILYDAIRDAVPLSDISSYRATENRLRHFERLQEWPEGLVTMGDAVCAFNPVYGQGMTTAALAAEELERCVKSGESTTKMTRLFQKRLARINRAAWMLATGEDLRYVGVEGAMADGSAKRMHFYVDHVLSAATHNISVRRSFLSVQGMLNGPEAIFRPAVVLQVAREAWRKNWSKAKQAESGLLAMPRQMNAIRGGERA